MSKALLRAALGEEMFIGSAGLAALHGFPADPLAHPSMTECGLDISSHHGRQLTAPIALAADFILIMYERQKTGCERMDTSIRGVSTFAGTGNRFSLRISLIPFERGPRPSGKPWEKSTDLLQTGFLT